MRRPFFDIVAVSSKFVALTSSNTQIDKISCIHVTTIEGIIMTRITGIEIQCCIAIKTEKREMCGLIISNERKRERGRESEERDGK